MAINYPGSLDNGTSLPNPTATNDTNSPSLSSGQDLQNAAIIALETKLGTQANTPPGDYAVLQSPSSGNTDWTTITPANAAGSTTGSGALFVLQSNATMFSPTINTATINNPVLKTDSVLGFTTANSGTVYGVSVTSGKVAGADVSNIPYASLLSNIFSGQITSTTNSGTAGGTLYYVNLGGIKVAWGISAVQTISAGGEVVSTVVLPGGFYSAIPQMINVSPYNLGGIPNQNSWGSNAATTGFEIEFYNPGPGIGTMQSAWLTIGT